VGRFGMDGKTAEGRPMIQGSKLANGISGVGLSCIADGQAVRLRRAGTARRSLMAKT
jgi:hypothetical protein